ncbi:uncharacterized protein LOC130914395 [Corythoichthys intestinalis]|uniref:uncharacterized protein LOC130914395 n=1 Tax=Corythoichthys intestinalis TaxID=161448 RepID=UPI0025A514A0|nr:uncharacterized protein LOC130914395 [Corythoichthys intestinalis]
MQILSIHFRNCNVEGITIANRTLTITQLADDTTLFLKDTSQIQKSIDVINVFSKASGLRLNIAKCELLPVKEWCDENVSGITVKHKVKYLGIIIGKDESARVAENFDPLIGSVQKKFNLWLQRDLSITGRSLVSKVEGISRLIYAAMALHVSKVICIKIDRILFNFIWKNKIHYIKKNVMINNVASGGFDALDFTSLNALFKIKWIKLYLKNPNSIWNFITTHIFKSVGGLDFLLRCNYNISKLPVKLAKFHTQLLMSWSMIYKHNFLPHRYYIWNNQDIQYRNRSLYIERWVQNNIFLVSQLLNEDGQLFTYQEFYLSYSMVVTPREYSLVFDAIPEGSRRLLQNSPKGRNCNVPIFDPKSLLIGYKCALLSSEASNHCLRGLIQKEIFSKPAAISYWNNLYKNIEWKHAWLLPRKYLLLRLLHRCYPVKTTMVKFKINIETLCSFCANAEETISHLFWECIYSHIFLVDLNNYINSKVVPSLKIVFRHILFGLANIEEPEMDKR